MGAPLAWGSTRHQPISTVLICKWESSCRDAGDAAAGNRCVSLEGPPRNRWCPRNVHDRRVFENTSPRPLWRGW